MTNDKSFESMARLVCDESDVRVEFGDFTPHSDLKKRIIRLPATANELTLEKRIELLCYLLHEIGHMRETFLPKQPGSGVSSEDTFVYVNLLEDVAIQKQVESYFGGSRDIYEYVIGKMLAERKKCTEKVYQRQRYIDHVLNMFVNMENLDYDPATVSRRDNKRLSIKVIYRAYLKARETQKRNVNNWSYDSSMTRAALALRSIFEGLPKGKGKGRGRGLGRPGEQEKTDHGSDAQKVLRELQEKASDKYSEANRATQDNRRKYNEKIRDLEREKESSLRESSQIKQEKDATPRDKAGKEKRKGLNKKLRDNVDRRREIKEELQEAHDDYREFKGDYAELEQECRELNQEGDALKKEASKQVPTTCLGLNQLPQEFFTEKVATLKQGTYGTLKRLFDVLKTIVRPAEQGSINSKRLSRYFDEQNLYKEHHNDPNMDVSLGFLLDSSSSMTTMYGVPQSNLKTCWESFASIANAVVKLSRREIGNLKYAVTSFTHHYEVLKGLKEKHTSGTLDKLKKQYLSGEHGGTLVEDPMKDMFRQLRKTEGRKIVFLITDGQFNDNFYKSPWYKQGIRNGIKVCVIAIGGNSGIRSGKKLLGREIPQFVDKVENLEGCLSAEIARALR